jgi:peptidyl-tRNA hydrolase
MILVGLGNPGKEYEKTRHNAGRMLVEFLAQKWGVKWQRRKDLAAEIAQKGDVWLVKPLVFMNESGRVVEKIVARHLSFSRTLAKDDEVDQGHKLGGLKEVAFSKDAGNIRELSLTSLPCPSGRTGKIENNSMQAGMGWRDRQDLGDHLLIIHDELDLPLGKWKLSFGKSSPLHKGILSVERHLKTKNFWRLRIGVDNRGHQSRISGEKYVLQRFTASEIAVLKKIFTEIFESLGVTFH